MRYAFTLIELLIVVAVIGIIAAIAIPNLMESRISSQEAAAAFALRSGVLPAEVQFQSGCYCDLDNNGIGCYAVDGIKPGGAVSDPFAALTGRVSLGNNITVSLLPPTYIYSGAVAYSSAVATGTTNTPLWPLVSGYQYKTPITSIAPSGSVDGTGERCWGVMCFPTDDSQGRRFFIVNQAAGIYGSKPSSVASDGAQYAGGIASSVLDAGAFGVSMSSAPSSVYYQPYHR